MAQKSRPASGQIASIPSAERPNLLSASSLALLLLALTVLGYGMYQALVVAPTEETMGNVQRIFYWHVPSAMLGLIFPYVNFAASLGYLYLRRRNPFTALAADAVAVASAEVALIFTSITLATGMLWGKASWGIWWAWDARLTSLLLLWLLYVAYLLTRKLSADGQTSTMGAVLAIFAAIDVPIVYFSIEWWRTQHPQPVLRSGHLDPAMWVAFGWNAAGWVLWSIWLVMLRYRLERRRQHVAQEQTLHSIEQSLLGDERLEPGNAF